MPTEFTSPTSRTSTVARLLINNINNNNNGHAAIRNVTRTSNRRVLLATHHQHEHQTLFSHSSLQNTDTASSPLYYHANDTMRRSLISGVAAVVCLAVVMLIIAIFFISENVFNSSSSTQFITDIQSNYNSLIRQFTPSNTADTQLSFSEAADAEWEEMKIAGPPFYDTAHSVAALPVLYPILAASFIPLFTSSQQSQTNLSSAVLEELSRQWVDQLMERVSVNHLQYIDVLSSPNYLNMSHPSLSSFKTTSTYNANYTIQTFNNICIKLKSYAIGGVVLIGPEDEMSVLQNATLTYGQGWLPARYQPTVTHQVKAESHWRYLAGTTFHQSTWDHNVGHQFHMQLMSMHRAVVESELYNTPYIQHFMIDSSRAVSVEEQKQWQREKRRNWLGIYQDRWFQVTEFLARCALQKVKGSVKLLKSFHSVDNEAICFERLVVNSELDMYMNYIHPSSAEAFRRFKSNLLSVLQIQQRPVDLSARPLRITIYSRHDAPRRRILNVDEIAAALNRHHIVRPIRQFGKQAPYEQFALFTQTDILIAPHGAHMTFAFLLPPAALIYEVFAHEEGHFSWIPKFVAATRQQHLQRIGISDMTGELSKEPSAASRNMDRNFKINTQQLCQDFKQFNIAVDC